MLGTTLIWFRQDLRQDDQPALADALQNADRILCVYIHAPNELADQSPGDASNVWLHHSLKSFASDLKASGLNLNFYKATSSERLLVSLCQKHRVNRVVWNRLYEPKTIERDRSIKLSLEKNNVEVKTFNGHLLWEPWLVKNKSGKPFQVFSAFWNSCIKNVPLRVLSHKPKAFKVTSLKDNLDSVSLESLDLLPSRPWGASMMSAWSVGEQSAQKRARDFIKKQLKGYQENRNLPDMLGTSQLSMALHFGELSVRRLWDWVEASSAPGKDCETYLKELAWREFAHHLLYHFPTMTKSPIRSEFSHFPWKENSKFESAWKRGLTGYPIVDAGMRQLWETGWMHNRVRMIVASFLVKDLFLPWQNGERWFWKTLVDADLANNSMGWQWTAGCGADAAPFFRVFNPVLQGEKFDPKGHYIQKWIPELKNLSSKWIHRPWEAPSDALKLAKVSLGHTYPHPIVDHSVARERALKAFKTLKKK